MVSLISSPNQLHPHSPQLLRPEAGQKSEAPVASVTAARLAMLPTTESTESTSIGDHLITSQAEPRMTVGMPSAAGFVRTGRPPEQIHSPSRGIFTAVITMKP